MKTINWIVELVRVQGWLEKLRRSAMSIAANAPWSFPKLRRSGMFVRRFMESFHLLTTRLGTMNRCGLLPLPIRLPRSDRGWGEGRGEGPFGIWSLELF